MSSLEAKILDVAPARLRYAEAVQPEEHGKRGVGVIEALGSELEEGLDLARRLLATNSESTAARHAVVVAMNRLSSLLTPTNPAESRHLLESCVAILEELLALSPESRLYAHDLRVCRAMLASLGGDAKTAD